MRRLLEKLRGRLRSIEAAVVVDAVLVVALTVTIAGMGAPLARAAEAPQIVVKVGGKLPVPPTIPLGVVATDPVLQQILSQDFQLAGRLAGASATSELTLTVTLTHRALEPGMSLNDVAPGNSDAVALLKQAGVAPLPLPEQGASDSNGESDDDDDTTAEGNSHPKNDVNSYEQQGQMNQGALSSGGLPLLPTTPWPVPPATAEQRSAIPPNMQPYQRTGPLDEARRDRAASAIYDTIFIARATVGSDGGELTVIAVAHPGFDAHEARKLMAEEIANKVLH
ncbi:MAG TPA: hypothetical protein VNE82_09785 [Candidatus Binataceae bacterium]|nr:hypothetical protein [Candidatus Binataceae bacterium]